MKSLAEKLSELQKIDFSGKGEAFVESNFLTPLLHCLGYEAHEDYEVRRHGDDGTSFKLRYPPVEKGAAKVKHYNPDYIPTIRKKAFWIVEAKSPRDVSHPFGNEYLIQGFQYCIHPEIQAKYLVVTNGINSSVYDVHAAVFLGKEMYQPILEFKASEIASRWGEVFHLLSVENLRARVESDLKVAYDKLCLSSLDEAYPRKLLQNIGADADANSRAIAKNVCILRVEAMERDRAQWKQELGSLTVEEVLLLLELPLPGGDTQAHCYVRKCLASDMPPSEILSKLIDGFDRQSIFRKEQAFVGVCFLYQQIDDQDTKLAAEAFLGNNKDADLPLLNQVECTLLRVVRKLSVLKGYPLLRDLIAKNLQTATELDRFVNNPSALSISYPIEVALHRQFFDTLRRLRNEELRSFLTDILKLEGSVEEEYKSARTKLDGSEVQIGGFEHYGLGARHYAFRNILANFKIGQTTPLTSSSPSATVC